MANLALDPFSGKVVGAGKHVVPSRPVTPELKLVLDWYYCKPAATNRVCQGRAPLFYKRALQLQDGLARPSSQ